MTSVHLTELAFRQCHKPPARHAVDRPNWRGGE